MKIVVAYVLLVLGIAEVASAATLNVQVVDAAGRPVRDAVVSARPLTGATGGTRFAFGRDMGQRNIQFTPGTLVVPVGTTVSFPNYDRVRHHVYSFSKAKKFELKLFGREATRSITFDAPGTVAVGCNIHDQMRGFIRVVNAPFAGTSNEGGGVILNDLPAGKLQLVIWHPQARARDNEVRVVAAAGTLQVIKLPMAGR